VVSARPGAPFLVANTRAELADRVRAIVAETDTLRSAVEVDGDFDLVRCVTEAAFGLRRVLFALDPPNGPARHATLRRST
jgi:hypothetical protein